MEELIPILGIISKLLLMLILFVGGTVVIGIIFSKIMNKGFKFSEMLENKMSKGKNIDPFWPTIKDRETAIIVAKNSSYFMFFIAFLFAILSFFEVFGVSALGLIDTIFYIVIGFGLYKLSRFAAVAGLALFLVSKVFALFFSLAIPSAFWVILVLLSYINGIRATFAFHKLPVDVPDKVI